MSTANLSNRLDGMVALVTGAGGGENAGIGGGIARQLARTGARIAVNDLSEASAAATVAQLTALGATAWPVIGSVADPDQADGLIGRTVEHFGQIDILVNNAGRGGFRATVDQMTDENWNEVLAVNLHGPFYTCRAAIRAMRPRGFGRIINISSLAAIRLSLNAGAQYTSSKEALLGLTRHLAVEVTQYGITVNAILPGLTDTSKSRAFMTAERRATSFGGVPAGRSADTEELGALAAFLASPVAGYITGQAIPVDGGVSLLPGDYSKHKNYAIFRKGVSEVGKG